MDTRDEVPLGVDGVTHVVRVGATVRRSWRESTPTVHAYLKHLRARGATFVPEPLGRDDQGREVLSFVPGDVPAKPLPTWATTDEVLAGLAVMIRELHDAAEGWTPPDGAIFGRLPAAPAPVHHVGDAGVIVAHGDYCPGNVVFADRRPVAIIDFDLAKPTTRVDDCVNALHWWAPLIDPRDRPEALREADIGARARLFAESYGMTAAQRRDVPRAALERAQRSLAWAPRSAAADSLFARWWQERWKDEMRRTVAWLRAQQGPLADA
jgi:Ser/Thr protein kinase RdoA (MazF antagonist)